MGVPFFSTRVRYALRLVLDVSRASVDGRPVSLDEVATRTGISRGYLEELVRPLKRAGIVLGRKGWGGGYLLARPPREITLRDIAEAAIGPLAVSECAGDPEACDRADYCECRMVFRLVSLQLQATLSALSVADMSDVRELERLRREFFALQEQASP
jgi:Rrf2 family protein